MDTPTEAVEFDYETLLAGIQAELQNVPDDRLQQLVALCNRMDELQAEIEEAEAHVKALKSRHQKVEQHVIPELMVDVLGIDNIGLPDGRQLTIGQFVSAHLTEEHKPAAFAWLRSHNYDAIIKKELKVSLGKVPQKKVEALVSKIIAAGHNDVAVTETVHGQTLKKFVKERLQTEADPDFESPTDTLPQDVFGVFNGRKATVK